MKKLIFFLVACFVATGCSTPQTATIPPSPQPVQVLLPSSLEPVRGALNKCAQEIPEIALIIDTRSSIDDLTGENIAIWWGDKPPQVNEAFPLANDELLVILNRENPTTELTPNQLTNLFNGRVERWAEINDYQQTVSVWTYPSGNQLALAFQSAVLGESSYSLLSFFAPSPREMLAAVKEDPGAIGFIPHSWLTSEVSAIEVDPESRVGLTKPLLALTLAQPRAAVLILIDCLQTGVGQATLLEKFSPPQ